EYYKNIPPWSSIIEIVGRIEEIVALKEITFQKTGGKGTVFKFVIANDDGTRIQILSWDDEINRVIPFIIIGSTIHIDGAFSKPIDNKNRCYNSGSVDIELKVESNTKINVLERMSSREVSTLETFQYPLISIEDCEQYLQKKKNTQAII
ncbi:hypothetical protein KQX54_012730, partial [Cotesia glomerata]